MTNSERSSPHSQKLWVRVCFAQITQVHHKGVRLVRVKAKNTTNRIRNNMPRNKGSLNKVTQDIKKVLQTVLEGQIDRIELALDDVYERNTVTYLQIITKLLPYLLPKAKEDNSIENSPKPFSWFDNDDDE